MVKKVSTADMTPPTTDEEIIRPACNIIVDLMFGQQVKKRFWKYLFQIT